jgi:NarL family two-component system sensor histidine kinase LiaS
MIPIDLGMAIKSTNDPPVAWFRRLRWKLTLSYALVSVGALLGVELLLLLGGTTYLTIKSRLTPRLLIQDITSQVVPVARDYLLSGPQDIKEETDWLKRVQGVMISATPVSLLGNLQLNVRVNSELQLYLLDANGVVLETVPADLVDRAYLDRPFDADLVPGLALPLEAALAAEDGSRGFYTIHKPDNRLVAVIPIMDTRGQQVLGAVGFATNALPASLWTLGEMAQPLGYSLLGFTLVAALMGTVFGSMTARNLVGRFHRLSGSAKAWSQGDFTVYVTDVNGDEVGQLGRDLNTMAQRLETLLDKRQEMSVLEERNRLARDLHDSAKQQAFAASAQLAAARALFRSQPAAAERHLVEAEALVDEVRQELTHLIQELRPATQTGTGLARSLREYALDWAQKNEIAVDVRVQGERPLRLEVERTLFRIAQEALANISRHSGARSVAVLLSFNATELTLSFADDGRGFELRDNLPGMGLRSMRERAELLDGCLVVESTMGRGTRVSVRCPG